jgi:hypothetical protein
MGLCDHCAVCLRTLPPLTYVLLNGRANFMKLGMYVMAHEHTLTAFFINTNHQYVCAYMCIPLSLLGNSR